jgi:AAA domain-containing protein
MALKTLEITGLRGFSTTESLRFACPDGRLGSGLTVLVGANNAGKSTVVEAIRALAQQATPGFSQGRRNRKAGDLVQIRLVDEEGGISDLHSIRPGTSEAEREPKSIDASKILVLPFRRTFSPYFSKSESTRVDYMNQMGFPAIRTSALDQFSYRLFSAHSNRGTFNMVLAKVEGQEDVIFYRQIQNQLTLKLEGTFFGWGVGGADKMERIALVLKDLGFEKVVGIVDNNKAPLLENLQSLFPKYRFFSIPAEDVRSKSAVPAKAPVVGLLDDKNVNIRSEYRSATQSLFTDINKFLTST